MKFCKLFKITYSSMRWVKKIIPSRTDGYRMWSFNHIVENMVYITICYFFYPRKYIVIIRDYQTTLSLGFYGLLFLLEMSSSVSRSCSALQTSGSCSNTGRVLSSKKLQPINVAKPNTQAGNTTTPNWSNSCPIISGRTTSPVLAPAMQSDARRPVAATHLSETVVWTHARWHSRSYKSETHQKKASEFQLLQG